MHASKSLTQVAQSLINSPPPTSATVSLLLSSPPKFPSLKSSPLKLQSSTLHLIIHRVNTPLKFVMTMTMPIGQFFHLKHFSLKSLFRKFILICLFIYNQTIQSIGIWKYSNFWLSICIEFLCAEAPWVVVKRKKQQLQSAAASGGGREGEVGVVQTRPQLSSVESQPSATEPQWLHLYFSMQ